MKFKFTLFFILIFFSVSFVCCQSDSKENHENTEFGERLKRFSQMDYKDIYDKALNHLSEERQDSALELFTYIISQNEPYSSTDLRILTNSLIKSAIIYYENFNYSRSMELLLQSCSIAENNDFISELAESYRLIGNIYSVHSDYGRAIVFYEQSLEKARETKDPNKEYLALTNLIASSLFNDQTEVAKEYYKELSKLPLDTPDFHYYLLIEEAMLEDSSGNIETAIDYYKKSAEFAHNNNLGLKNQRNSYFSLASIFQRINQPDSALYYLHFIEDSARKDLQMDLLIQTVKSLASIYRDKGQLEKSQRYLEEYINLSDSIFNQQRFNKLKDAQFEYDLGKEQIIIQKLNEEKLKQKGRLEMHRIFLMVITISACILAVFLVIIYRQKTKITRTYSDLFERAKENLKNEEIYMNRIRDLEENREDIERREIDEDRGTTKNEGDAAELPDDVRKRIEREIAKVMDNIEIICDSSFSIYKLAELIDSNTSYVSKVINDIYGKNFRTFLNEYRVKESMRRLSDTETFGKLTIKAIAEDVGFKSQSTFIAAFTNYTGIKPSLYQKMSQKDK